MCGAEDSRWAILSLNEPELRAREAPKDSMSVYILRPLAFAGLSITGSC